MKNRLRNFIAHYLNMSLKDQLMFCLVAGVLLPLIVVSSLLFVRAKEEMKKQAILNTEQSTAAMASKVEDLLRNIYSVSDKFAYDEVVVEQAANSYEGRPEMEKWNDIHILNSYFTKCDPFGKSERISAIYTKKQEVMNLKDPYENTKLIEGMMLALGAKEKEYLSVFQWFPLQDDFLVANQTDGSRMDQVVVGLRRIMHPYTGSWMYTQFFTIEEQKIYEQYSALASEIKGEVVVLNAQNQLISSSVEQMVMDQQVPISLLEEIQTLDAQDKELMYRGERYIASSKPIAGADWRVITLVPVEVVTRPLNQLFQGFILILLLCLIVCSAVGLYLLSHFLKPVDVLKDAMQAVYEENLEAYVDPSNYYGEIRAMMSYYNTMLLHINQSIEERVKYSEKKKALELEVLMGQVNPHFLYNTLENIVWKSNEAGYPEIGRIAAQLGRLYRLSINNGDILISLHRELEHVMAYINIQKNRYKEKMDFEVLVDYDQIVGCSIIKLTLQPIIENCFMYAMEGLEGVLKITLKVRVEEEVIRFWIMDNGVGMTKDQLHEVRKQIQSGKTAVAEEQSRRRKGTGIGLYCVKERIAIYTGRQDSVKIYSNPRRGTIVQVILPKNLVENSQNTTKG